MSIPKLIHYVWLSGEEKPKSIKECMKTWKILQKNGFEIKEWTAKDFNFDEMPAFVQEALKERKWAFVTDYLRLKILYERGGVYLDSDVIIKKDISGLMDGKYFTFVEFHKQGFKSHQDLIDEQGNPLTEGIIPYFNLQAAFIGAEKGCKFLKECMDWYEGKHFYEDWVKDTVAPDIYALCARKYGFRYKDELQKIGDGMIIYPSCYCAGSLSEVDKRNYAVHCCDGSWRDYNAINRFLRHLRLLLYKTQNH